MLGQGFLVSDLIAYGMRASRDACAGHFLVQGRIAPSFTFLIRIEVRPDLLIQAEIHQFLGSGAGSRTLEKRAVCRKPIEKPTM